MADFLTYKGLPLVRKGNEIYYGDMAQPQVIKFEVLPPRKPNRGIFPKR